MKKKKLEEGQIWQKKGTLDVRTINYISIEGDDYDPTYLLYFDIGGEEKNIAIKAFRRWIRRNSHAHQMHNVKLIGHYDFETGKARAVKCP